jgi:hypothetical protein
MANVGGSSKRSGFCIGLALCLWLSSGCAGTTRQIRPEAEAWIRTELYFGLTRPEGARISGEAWRAFVQDAVLPRFPDGFTVIDGEGQYRGRDGQSRREPSAILIVLHPAAQAREDGAKLDAIATEYDRRFQQESVLRSDARVDVRFIEGPSGKQSGVAARLPPGG